MRGCFSFHISSIPTKRTPLGSLLQGPARGPGQVDGNELQVRWELREKARCSAFHPGHSFHSLGRLISLTGDPHKTLAFGWVESSLDANI